jgi:heme/copper-type cytochrome/quinol oxidase subunit 2
MDVNVLLSTIVLVAFIVTIVLAVGSYLAFKGREHRRPEPELAPRKGEAAFFERIYLQARKDDEPHIVPV